MKIIVITLPYTQFCPPPRPESYKWSIKSFVSMFCVQFSIILRATVKLFADILKCAKIIWYVINVSLKVYIYHWLKTIIILFAF